jgi:hypothetical protein
MFTLPLTTDFDFAGMWLEQQLDAGYALQMAVEGHVCVAVAYNNTHFLFYNSFGDQTDKGGFYEVGKYRVIANVVDAATFSSPWLEVEERVDSGGGDASGGGSSKSGGSAKKKKKPPASRSSSWSALGR